MYHSHFYPFADIDTVEAIIIEFKICIPMDGVSLWLIVLSSTKQVVPCVLIVFIENARPEAALFFNKCSKISHIFILKLRGLRPRNFFFPSQPCQPWSTKSTKPLSGKKIFVLLMIEMQQGRGRWILLENTTGLLLFIIHDQEVELLSQT